MVTPKFLPPWHEIDTVLLDMDGTLLDLAFDNFFWLELVPRRFASLNRIDDAVARREIGRRYAEVSGTLAWYCVDHWTAELGLDIRKLKREHGHLIRYLPMAQEFLRRLRGRRKRLILVTNAHRDTLAVKIERTAIDGWMDAVVSAHDYRAPKESEAFWNELNRRHPFEPKTTLLLEDSEPVLNAAKTFGVEHLIAIRRPDSRHTPREISGFDAVDGVSDLI